MEELRQGVQEVQHLRDEEQQHGLAEVAQDPHHGEGHPCKVTEGISHEHRGGVPGANHRQAQGEVTVTSKKKTHPVTLDN